LSLDAEAAIFKPVAGAAKEKFIKNIFSSGRSGKYYKKYFLSLCYFILSTTCIE